MQFFLPFYVVEYSFLSFSKDFLNTFIFSESLDNFTEIEIFCNILRNYFFINHGSSFCIFVLCTEFPLSSLPCTILSYLLYFDKAVCKLCFSIIYLRNFSEFCYYLVLNGLTLSLVKFVIYHVLRVSSEEQ